MKRTISRFVRRISRQEEIDKLKLEIETLRAEGMIIAENRVRHITENHELKQTICQMAEDIRGLKENRDKATEGFCDTISGMGQEIELLRLDKEKLQATLEESERDVKRINSEYGDARGDLRMTIDRIFMTLATCDTESEARALADISKLYLEENGFTVEKK